MKSKLIIVLLITLLGSLHAMDAISADDTPQAQINALINQLRSGAVERVDIMQIPPRVLTRTRVTPDMLEQSFHYKLIIHDVRGGLYEKSLVAAAMSTSAESSAQMGDLRWGMIFFDGNDHRVGSIYFDASGRRGSVGSTAASFNSELPKWLDENFGKVFK